MNVSCKNKCCTPGRWLPLNVRGKVLSGIRKKMGNIDPISPWSFPKIFLPKPDGKWIRLPVNYGILNFITKPNWCLMPGTIESIGSSLDYLYYWFMKKVLANGLQQRIQPGTAFVIPDVHLLGRKIHLSFSKNFLVVCRKNQRHRYIMCKWKSFVNGLLWRHSGLVLINSKLTWKCSRSGSLNKTHLGTQRSVSYWREEIGTWPITAPGGSRQCQRWVSTRHKR